jgi:tryptophan-rich sensory protein
MKASSLVRLVVCVVLCLGVGAVGSLFTTPEIPTWYASLNKPAWTPPNGVFPIVWTTLYAMMAVTLWLLWERVPPSPARSTALGWFLVQLTLNAIWSPIFFGAHATVTALIVIALLLVAIVMTIRATWPLHRPAAMLLFPYLAWIAYASTLNAGIVALN